MLAGDPADLAGLVADPSHVEHTARGVLSGGDEDARAPLNPYRYTGRRWDAGSGSLDMGARRFGPDVGRFLSRDRYLGAVADLGLSLDALTGNRYALAGGNPLSFVEVDGHTVIPDGGGGSASSPTATGGSDGGSGGVLAAVGGFAVEFGKDTVNTLAGAHDVLVTETFNFFSPWDAPPIGAVFVQRPTSYQAGQIGGIGAGVASGGGASGPVRRSSRARGRRR